MIFGDCVTEDLELVKEETGFRRKGSLEEDLKGLEVRWGDGGRMKRRAVR